MSLKQTGIVYKSSPSFGHLLICSLDISIRSIAGNKMSARNLQCSIACRNSTGQETSEIPTPNI